MAIGEVFPVTPHTYEWGIQELGLLSRRYRPRLDPARSEKRNEVDNLLSGLRGQGGELPPQRFPIHLRHPCCLSTVVYSRARMVQGTVMRQ